MKVLLYFEKEEKIKTSGIGRALRHQIAALTSAGIEYTLNPKDTYDIAHINTYFPHSKRLLKRLKRKHIPVIVHGHSTIEDFKNSFRLWKLMAVWFNPNLMYFYKHADLIITPTEYSKRCIDAYKLGTEVRYVSNGIDSKEYAYDEAKIEAFKKHFDIKDGEKVIIGVGFPFNRKGIKDFFEIARKRPDIKFIWFGHLARALTQINVLKAIKNRPANVIMPGYIDNAIIKGAYRYAKCLLFTSYEETEGIVVLEALTSSCPVLVRDIGVYSDWLEDGRDCYKAKNNEEFLMKIDHILTHDNSYIIKNGQLRTEERDIPIVGQQLKEAYQYLLDKFKKNNEK